MANSVNDDGRSAAQTAHDGGRERCDDSFLSWLGILLCGDPGEDGGALRRFSSIKAHFAHDAVARFKELVGVIERSLSASDRLHV